MSSQTVFFVDRSPELSNDAPNDGQWPIYSSLHVSKLEMLIQLLLNYSVAD